MNGAAPGREFTVTVALVGAATLVSLVLVMQDPTHFEVTQKGLFLTLNGEQEFQAITVFLGAVCVFSAFSVLALAFVGAGMVRSDGLLGWFGYALGVVTIVGFGVAVWLLLSQEGDPESDVTLGLIAVLTAVFFVGVSRGIRAPRPNP